MSSLEPGPESGVPDAPSAVHRSQGRYWRDLAVCADKDSTATGAADEFFPEAAIWPAALSRRRFLSVMGASLALATANGCTRPPDEKIVPYVKQPEGLVPGKPLYFATAMTLGGAGTGLLVASHEGRPTKIEGNPKHPSVPPAYGAESDPARAGASDIFMQAAILALYDPDRSQAITLGGQISTWDSFLTQLRQRLDTQPAGRGHRIRVLTETIASPTFLDQLERLQTKWPKAWVEFEPINRDYEAKGTWLAFGEALDAQYDLARADVILSIDADLLTSGPEHLQHGRRFADRRRVQGDASGAEMSRLYAVETSPTLTGAVADHRLPLRQAELELFVQSLAARLGVDVARPDESRLSKAARRWLEPVSEDLRSYRRRRNPGTAVVVAGLWQPPAVHALAHALNHALGALKAGAVAYRRPLRSTAANGEDAKSSADHPPEGQVSALRGLVAEMGAGDVDLLVILGGNPAYTAPADFNFAEAMRKVPLVVHLSAYQDETSSLCHWHIPESHFLESWSDTRAYDGTATIVQPLIAPLYESKSAHDVVAALLGEPGFSAHDVVKRYWRSTDAGAGFEDRWQTALHDGVIAGTRGSAQTVNLRSDFRRRFEAAQTTSKVSEPSAAAPSEPPKIDLLFRPDPTLWDGRFANNGWLQELPKPLTKLTWDNAALIGPELARHLDLRSGDGVTLEHAAWAVNMPVWVTPGHARDSLTLHLGHGRTRAGRVGNGVGTNAYLIRTSRSPWRVEDVAIRKSGQRRELACAQPYHGLERLPGDHGDDADLLQEREIIRSGTLRDLQKNPQQPAFMGVAAHSLPSLYPDVEYRGHRWGMSIDLGSCLGCSACTIACQAENNIPVVGAEQVRRGRAMHWIRVDTYYRGEPEAPDTFHQPIPCMHCEHAPCEPVCPVAATVHSDEGLNQMVYNRCVGTRYCSNNCPYKVRRFNFLQYTDLETPVLKLLRNPEVTVRNRGVMEKCTYCVQRITAARITAEKRGEPIRDGEIVTACQAACPTQAIVFGDLSDPQSAVSQRKEAPLDYALLGELDTRPRTTYLAAIKNPHAALVD